MTPHQCNFQDEIIELVKNSGEMTEAIKNLTEKVSKNIELQEVQQKDVDALKTFKRDIVIGAGVCGSVFGFIFCFIGNMFQGCLDWIVHK